MKHDSFLEPLGLVLLALAACGAGGDAGEACTAIAERAVAVLPHVVTEGDPARAVVSALGALIGAQVPAVAEGAQTYALQDLSCAEVFTPSASGVRCTLNVSIDGRAPVAISAPDRPDLLEGLFDALSGAGADACNDFAHGNFLRLSNVAIDIPSGRIEFDDASQYSLPPPPNVRASGAEGAAVTDAMVGASVDDCDPSRTVFIVCNKFTESPVCSATFFPLENVGGSELVGACVPPIAVGASIQLGAPAALALWNAIVGAAAASGYSPLHGTIEQATIINAQYFTWDGTTVGFQLTADNASPPPSRGP